MWGFGERSAVLAAVDVDVRPTTLATEPSRARRAGPSAKADTCRGPTATNGLEYHR